MKYVLLVHRAADQMAAVATTTGADPKVELAEYAALKADLIAAGTWLGGQALHDASVTTQVRVVDGQTIVVDGPLAETAEQIAGYYLLDCRDLDEAVAIAARVPAARAGTIEVRPVWDYEAELGGG